MSKIQQTTNYGKFLVNEINRDVKKTDMLEKSFLKHGWIDAYPMHVVANADMLTILAGNHRFTVAKKLGIPVKYVICAGDDVTIHELEQSTNSWSMQDYLTSYFRLGLKDYEYVENYRIKTGYPVSVCVSVCAGMTASGASTFVNRRFKNGDYTIGNIIHAEELFFVTSGLMEIGIKFCTNSNFLKALSKCIIVDQFSIKYFLKKAKTHKAIFEKKPNIELYMAMIESAYNKGSRNSIPLVFLANEAARKRNPITRGK